MLTELEELQESKENVWETNIRIEVETRIDDENEIVQKSYTFCYSPEWDKWSFTEYIEKRTPDTTRMGDRNWRKAQHIFWNDAESATIDVPPEVSKSLAEATGAESVTIQVPHNSVNESMYKQFTYTCD